MALSFAPPELGFLRVRFVRQILAPARQAPDSDAL